MQQELPVRRLSTFDICLQWIQRITYTILKSLTARKEAHPLLGMNCESMEIKKSIALPNVLLFRISCKSIDINRNIAPSNVPWWTPKKGASPVLVSSTSTHGCIIFLKFSFGSCGSGIIKVQEHEYEYVFMFLNHVFIHTSTRM